MKKFKLIVLLFTAMTAIMLFQNKAFGQIKTDERWYTVMEARGKYGIDSAFCIKQLAIFTELVKQQNYKDAYDSWTILFNNYPMCSQNIYSRGVNIVKYQLSQCKTYTAQQPWIDTLMLVYDRRIHFFGAKSKNYPEGYILGRKGVDMQKFRPEHIEDSYNTLNKSIELQGEKSEAAVILCAMKATIDMENAHVISRDVVTNNYQKYIKLLNANKTEPSDIVEKAIEGVNDFYNLGYAASLSNNTASTNNTTSSSTSTSNNTSSNVTSNNNTTPSSLLNLPQGAVDLGLPSGTLWANRNVGADNTCDCGVYFAYGELQGKKNYSWDTYKYANGARLTLKKYTDNEDIQRLDPKLDAASVIMRDNWRTPTREDFIELMEYCDMKIERNYKNTGIRVLIVYNRNDRSKYIVIPGCGFIKGSTLYNSSMYKNGHIKLWSSSTDLKYRSNQAFYFSADDGNSGGGKAYGNIMESDYYIGMVIRAVIKK